jgi:hypothetical protein
MFKKTNGFIWLSLMVSIIFAMPVQGTPVKYNGPASGNDEPAAMALDSQGNVYVTGKSWGGIANGYDIVTVKYSPQGKQKWAARYVGPAGDDIPTGIVVNYPYVYVTGYSRRNADPSITDYDFVTIKYYIVRAVDADIESPLKLWAQRYDYGGYHDEAVGIALASDRVYVTGNSYNRDGLYFATLAYDLSGNLLWARRYYAGPYLDGLSGARALAVNSAGDVFMTGGAGPFNRAGNQYDILTVKYNANGSPAFAARFVGVPMALKVWGSSVIVAGYTMKADSSFTFLTIKYNFSLGQQWNRVYDAWSLSEFPTDLAINSQGDLYAAGVSMKPDYHVLLSYTGGVEQFRFLFSAPNPDLYEVTTKIAIDAQNNVYLTGCVTQSPQGCDFGTMKLNGWAQRFSTSGQDVPRAIAVDAAGNVYVTGYSPGAGQGYDMVTVKYSTNGQVLW